MKARKHSTLKTTLVVVSCLLIPIGCTKSATDETPPYAASGGADAGDAVVADSRPQDFTATQADPATVEASSAPIAASRPGQRLFGVSPDQPEEGGSSVAVQTDTRQRGDAGSVGLPLTGASPAEASGRGTPFTVAGAQGEDDPGMGLRPDLSPKKLLEFLAGADQDMSLIVTGRSGIEDPEEARRMLIQIIKMKLEASRRLAEHQDADAKMKSEGGRGELQALSHLAALGDVKVANQLEELAKSNLDSSDPQLVADSRLVLVGFAIESLQNGDEDAAGKIIQYVTQLAQSESSPGVPAMMVMGQARDVLASYGHDTEARRVRDLIIDLFADSPEPQIAQMAAQLAGNVRFDGIEKLRELVMDGQSLSPARWREAVETLIDESADLQTVQYLAGAALEFEAMGQSELAKATYETMEARFDDPNSATQREVRLAVDASRARQEVIGREFSPDLDQIDGSPLDMAEYAGKVVLMPFWAMSFPESLQLIPRIEEIQKTFGDQVAVVGVNLDAEGARVSEFVASQQLGFPSYRAPSSATADVANTVAAKFGMVSMPFTAILDRKGRVAALNFTGRDLEQTVQRLLEP